MTLHVDSVGIGPPLAILHGFALHGGLFASVLPVLGRNYRVHVVDLPGHGHSTAQADTLDSYVDEVVATLDAIGERTVLLGWSFGGQIAMRLAYRYPRRVTRLILACTTPKFVADETWRHAMSAATLARFGDELRVSYRLTLQRFLTLQVQGSDTGKATLTSLREALFARAAPSAEALAGVLRILATGDLREEARTIATPTLVISGQRDALTPAAAGAWLARAMPHARYVEIDGAAHAPFLSHATQFVSAVKSFLDVHTAALSRP